MPASWQLQMESSVNQAVMGLSQIRDPIQRATTANELLDLLERAVKSVSDQRQKAVAETLLWKDMSTAKVAGLLGLSKSYVAKLAPAEFRERVARQMREELSFRRFADWANGLRYWGPMNTTGLGNGRVLYLIASVSRARGHARGEWLVQVHDHRSPEPVELLSKTCRTEAEARVTGVQELLRRNDRGFLNGVSERRHYAHLDINVCGAPLDDRRAARTDPITCVDCLAALGLL